MIQRRFADFLNRLRRGVREEERARLVSILGLNRALADARDIRSMLASLLDEAVRLFGAERGFVVLRDGPGEDLDVPVARSLDAEAVRQPLRKISKTVVQECLAAGQGLFCADAQEGDFGAAQSVADQRLRSVLCMPLQVGEEVLGCIYLDHRFQAGVFTEADLPWFQAFADQGAIALHLHRLVQDSQSRAAAAEARTVGLEATLRSELSVLQRQPAVAARKELRYPYPEIVGESAALLNCLHLLDRIMDKDFSVLLVGESGTGKELCARAIHAHGTPAGAPYVAVNVAAISPGLLESELFGHVRGAFTGADRDRAGLIQQAAGGVLFLDEVTEMDLELQAKLLRFLEEGAVRAVGSDQVQEVQLRIVAATNRDPLEVIESGAFRRDLYYRLAVVTVPLPPLRERREDIPLLVEHFLRQAAEDRAAPLPNRVGAELLSELVRRLWPGNLRQLRNAVMRLDAMADDGELRGADLEPEDLRGAEAAPDELNLGRLEQQAVARALEVSGGNKAEAARLLGISRRALYNKLGRG